MKYLVIAEPKRDHRSLFVLVMVVNAETKTGAAKIAIFNSCYMKKSSYYKAIQVMPLEENHVYRI